MMKTRIIAALMAVLMLLTCCTALAEGLALPFDPDQVPVFLFRRYEEGIGLGKCPVYTAPSTEAFRVPGAAVRTDADIYVGGRDASGWLMVRYGTRNRGERVGYIPRSYVVGNFTARTNLDFCYITCVAQTGIDITDNPKATTDPFGTIPQGGVFAILAQYTYIGDWWYVECRIDGRFARGFIPKTTEIVLTSNTVVTVPDLSTFAQASPEGSMLRGTVTVIGDACLVRADAGTDFKWVARARSYDVLPFYGTKTGTNNHTWYQVCVDGTWGWIAGTLVREN